MIRDRSITARRRFYWAPRISAIAVVMLPISLHRVDYRASFGHGLAIATNKSSPAYAAFEDSHETFETRRIKIPEPKDVLALHSRYQPHPLVLTSGVRSVALKGLTIRSQTDLTPQPAYIAGETKLRQAPLALVDRRGELLSLQDRKRILAQQITVERDQYIVPSAGALARTLAEKELATLPSTPPSDRREIRSVTGNTIVIARAEPPPAPSTKPEDKKDDDRVASFMASVSSVRPVPDAIRPLWLNGQIEMTGGLAFVGSSENTLVVKRMVNGEVLEKGRIWINEGRFEIYVKSATGELVAELLGHGGRVLGRGEVNLVNLQEIPSKDNRIKDIRIALRPTTDGATMRTVSGYSHGQQMMPVREAKVEIQNYSDPQRVNDEGYYSEPTLAHNSTFVARASAPRHWSSLVVGQADHPQDIRLFSNKMMDALIGLELGNQSDRREAGLASVVWGQIRRDGKAVSGAVVEMAGNYRPIYFNEWYLPDTNLKSTTSNGLFAFINVKRGVQALRVANAGRMYPAQVFPTEDKHVSYIELELEDKLVTQFRVLDVLNMSTPIEARLRLVGTDEIVPLKDQGLIQYANGANPFMVEAEAGVDYEVSRVTLTGHPSNIHIPMIRHDWLTSLFNQNNILSLPGRGIIVGFVDDQDFDVELTGYGTKERMQIVYFDARGNKVEGRNGVAGGGFVIFNAPIGLQTLYIHPLQSRDTFSQIVVAEPEYVHVLTWSASAH